MSDGLRVLHNKWAIYKSKEEYSNKDKILWWKLSKKKKFWGVGKQIGRKEFWTFPRLELNLGFGKLNYV